MGLHDTEQYSPADVADTSFNLISRLVAEMFLEEGETLAMTAKAGEFFHDSNTRVDVANSVKIFITKAALTETGFRTVITMSGVFENLYGDQYTLSLYFILKREIPVIPRKRIHVDKLIGQWLTFAVSPAPEVVYDSLFALTLDCQPSGENNSLFGEGKGYLVFGKSI